MADTAAPRKSAFGTPLVILSFALVLLILFYAPARDFTGLVFGYILNPIIGFGGKLPLLTIFLASVVLVIATTAIRHFLVDWVKMARVQEAMRSFNKELMQARKDNNTYKMKKLTDAQPEVLQMQAEVSTEQMKPMALTMLLVIPIFAWLGVFLLDVASASGNAPIEGHTPLYFAAPWAEQWDIMENFNWPWGAEGFLPRWIVLYSLFGIPFGQIAQRALKLWEYRHVDLDGDGKPAGKA